MCWVLYDDVCMCYVHLVHLVHYPHDIEGESRSNAMNFGVNLRIVEIMFISISRF